MNRVPNNYAFIDSQNLNLNIQKAGWKMDWHKFRRYLAEKYGVTKAFMFIGYVPEFEDMYVQLHDTGYLIVLKPTFDLTRPRPEEDDKKRETRATASDGSNQAGAGHVQNAKEGDGKESTEEKKPVKGNVDAELVLHAMIEYPNYDKAIIVSGDGDFYCLVEYLHEQKKLLKLLTPTRKYSNLFNRFEDYIVRVDQLRNQLEYRKRRKP